MSLGSKLAEHLKQLEIHKASAEQAAAIAKVAKEKADRERIERFCDRIKRDIIEQLESDRIPFVKEESYDRMTWIESARKGKAGKNQDIWTALEAWALSEDLQIIVGHSHDGVGIKSWLTISVKPTEPTFGREIGFGRPVGRELI